MSKLSCYYDKGIRCNSITIQSYKIESGSGMSKIIFLLPAGKDDQAKFKSNSVVIYDTT